MKKFILPIFFFYVINSNGYAQSQNDLKLKCEISKKDQYMSGTIKNEKHSIIIEIIQNKSYLSITPNSILGGVMSKNSGGVYEIYNFSDENKWDLTTFSKDANEEKVTRTRITIDRNTVEVFYEQDFQEKILTTASGICSKIAKSKKKF